MGSASTTCWHRLVLPAETPTATVFEFGAAGRTLCIDQPRGGRFARIRAWRGADGTELQYIEEHHEGVRLLALLGPDADAVRPLLVEVTSTFLLYGEGELLAAADAATTPEDITTALNAIRALWTTYPDADATTPDQHQRLIGLVGRLAGYPHRQVRRAVIRTARALGGRRPELTATVLARRAEETELAHLLDTLAPRPDSDVDN
jgi:hypothetical protein